MVSRTILSYVFSECVEVISVHRGRKDGTLYEAAWMFVKLNLDGGLGAGARI